MSSKLATADAFGVLPRQSGIPIRFGLFRLLMQVNFGESLRTDDLQRFRVVLMKGGLVGSDLSILFGFVILVLHDCVTNRIRGIDVIADAVGQGVVDMRVHFKKQSRFSMLYILLLGFQRVDAEHLAVEHDLGKLGLECVNVAIIAQLLVDSRGGSHELV